MPQTQYEAKLAYGYLGGRHLNEILVVDDDPNFRELMNQTLESMGYKPITAANGNEGVEKAIFYKPDLVLLDVMLPDIDGPQVANILRDDPATKNIPIVGMSAAFGFSVRQSYIKVGFTDFIAKPFTYEVLEEKLRAFTTSS